MLCLLCTLHCTVNLRGTEELGAQYCKYVRERGEVEREYARALRKLVVRHQPKEAKKEKIQETSQVNPLTPEIEPIHTLLQFDFH